MAEVARDLLAKVPKEVSRNGHFVKSDFVIDLEADQVSCPGGRETTTTFSTSSYRLRALTKTFTFGSVCADCPLRSACTTARAENGRSISVHPQEARLREARAYQKTSAGKARLRQRVVVEHRLARLGQLGISQARYRSRVKTRFQLMDWLLFQPCQLPQAAQRGKLGQRPGRKRANSICKKRPPANAMPSQIAYLISCFENQKLKILLDLQKKVAELISLPALRTDFYSLVATAANFTVASVRPVHAVGMSRAVFYRQRQRAARPLASDA